MKAYHTYKAIEIAHSLLKHADTQGKSFTQLQLQKLTYVCHGLSLALYDRPLIIEDVYAWQYGPVVPPIYFCFKKYGSQHITVPDQQTELDPKSDQIIRYVVTKLGDLSGGQLVELTHRQGSPWSKVWGDGRHGKKVIPDDIIKEHYTSIQTSGIAHAL